MSRVSRKGTELGLRKFGEGPGEERAFQRLRVLSVSRKTIGPCCIGGAVWVAGHFDRGLRSVVFI